MTCEPRNGKFPIALGKLFRESIQIRQHCMINESGGGQIDNHLACILLANAVLERNPGAEHRRIVDLDGGAVIAIGLNQYAGLEEGDEGRAIDEME